MFSNIKWILSACRSVIDRIFQFWLTNDYIFKISKCGRTFYSSIKVLHDFTDKVCILTFFFIMTTTMTFKK